MTDHIIKAAQEAGFAVQRDEWVLQTMLPTFPTPRALPVGAFCPACP